MAKSATKDAAQRRRWTFCFAVNLAFREKTPSLDARMTKLLDLTAYRNRVVEKRAFGPWSKRFGESYSTDTKLADLSDRTLYSLAKPGEETALAYYELVMGVLGLGEAPRFYYLGDKEQLMVMDIHLFVADQVRLELMRRLGWISDFPGKDYALVEMVQAFKAAKEEARQKPAAISKSHPEYNAYNKLIKAEKQIFIRRKFLKALEEFRARTQP
jgi:hypothetical protein